MPMMASVTIENCNCESCTIRGLLSKVLRATPVFGTRRQSASCSKESATKRDNQRKGKPTPVLHGGRHNERQPLTQKFAWSQQESVLAKGVSRQVWSTGKQKSQPAPATTKLTLTLLPPFCSWLDA